MLPERVTFELVTPDTLRALVARYAQTAWDRQRVLLIAATDMAEAEAMDEWLWSFEEDAFLPHEVRTTPASVRDTEARIVIAPFDAPDVMVPVRDVLLQLQPMPFEIARTFKAVVDLVPDHDEAAKQRSRERFKVWRDAGIRPEYRGADYQRRGMA
jgi:DNA polymerase-3 subunit chi